VENHRISKIKKKRKSGFLVRMNSRKGRRIVNRQRSKAKQQSK
jgi:ribosomal protein L34